MWRRRRGTTLHHHYSPPCLHLLLFNPSQVFAHVFRLVKTNTLPPYAGGALLFLFLLLKVIKCGGGAVVPPSTTYTNPTFASTLHLNLSQVLARVFRLVRTNTLPRYAGGALLFLFLLLKVIKC